MKLFVNLMATITMVAAIVIPSLAQDCESYFPMDEGVVRVMESYNAKDKLEGKFTYKVNSVTQTGNSTEIMVHLIAEDRKGKETYQGDLLMECADGVFKMDMKNFISGALAGMGDMEMTVESKNLEYPSGLHPGMELPDGFVKISMEGAMMSMMGFQMDIFNRKVEGIEVITTPAGSFECFKISQDSESKTMMKVEAKSIEWVALNVGVVRTENYDQKGVLQGYSVLTRIE